MQLKTIVTTIYILLMGYVAIGTVLHIENPKFESIWFASVWATIITGGIYFSITSKNKWLGMMSTGFTSWFFSMFTFEIIGIFNPTLIMNVDKPSATYVWYLTFFMAYVVIIAFRYGRTTHK